MIWKPGSLTSVVFMECLLEYTYGSVVKLPVEAEKWHGQEDGQPRYNDHLEDFIVE